MNPAGQPDGDDPPIAGSPKTIPSNVPGLAFQQGVQVGDAYARVDYRRRLHRTVHAR
ncbi:MAG TPA: hypothetical protein VFD84_16310 [Candidatus Binatia bacterium]|jgi:hypothetical protein|nr:hypothetical protein [Candidatus Binatia bacterium]